EQSVVANVDENH
ncbi:tetrapyrrole (Corrin/Porphyrin) Methylases family protein, partial [Vibrio parahaemolyticus V-223/04]